MGQHLRPGGSQILVYFYLFLVLIIWWLRYPILTPKSFHQRMVSYPLVIKRGWLENPLYMEVLSRGQKEKQNPCLIVANYFLSCRGSPVHKYYTMYPFTFHLQTRRTLFTMNTDIYIYIHTQPNKMEQWFYTIVVGFLGYDPLVIEHSYGSHGPQKWTAWWCSVLKSGDFFGWSPLNSNKSLLNHH